MVPQVSLSRLTPPEPEPRETWKAPGDVVADGFRKSSPYRRRDCGAVNLVRIITKVVKMSISAS